MTSIDYRAYAYRNGAQSLWPRYLVRTQLPRSYQQLLELESIPLQEYFSDGQACPRCPINRRQPNIPFLTPSNALPPVDALSWN